MEASELEYKVLERDVLQEKTEPTRELDYDPGGYQTEAQKIIVSYFE